MMLLVFFVLALVGAFLSFGTPKATLPRRVLAAIIWMFFFGVGAFLAITDPLI